jgi:hypothetical protein
VSRQPTTLLIGAAARLSNYSVDYFRELADRGDIPCERDAEGRRVFKTKDVFALMKKRQRENPDKATRNRATR